MRPIEIKKGEETVNKTVEAVKSFVNPFTIEDKENLYNITSGVKVSKIIENDVINAEKIGEDQRVKFITERLKKQEFFFDPIKKVKLKTMADGNKRTKVRGKQGKLIEIKQHGNIAFQLLIKAQKLHKNINLAEVVKYQLTPVPSSLGSPDGYLAKTNKAKSMQYLTKDLKDCVAPPPQDTLVIVDGNAVFHSLTEIPESFQGICEKTYKMIPKTSDVIFSMDSYYKESVKEQERRRRGVGDVFLVKGPNMKRPFDWKLFLSNGENKEVLGEILLKVWSNDNFAPNLHNRHVKYNINTN